MTPTRPDDPAAAPPPDPGPSPQPSRRTRRWRLLRWSALAVVVATIGIGAVFGSRLGTDPTLVDSPLIGTSASTRALPDLEDEGSLSLTQLRGRVVVVNFWASWCVACREEHPALTAAAGAYQPAGVAFVGVDYQDQPGEAIRFLDELGRAPGARYVTDPGSAAALDFGVFGVPETFVLDRRGTIVGKITGPSTYPLLGGVLDAVLAGRPPPRGRNGTVQSTPAPAAGG